MPRRPKILEGTLRDAPEIPLEAPNPKVNYIRNEEKPPYEMSQYQHDWPPAEEPMGEPYDDLAPDMRAILDREPEVPGGAPHFKVNGTGVEISQPNVYRGGPKRTLTEREADLVLITKWYLEGMNHHQIAERLSNHRGYTIKRVQVTTVIHEIYRRWQLSYLTDMNKLKVRELAKIDKLEAEYYEAWENSKVDKTSLERTQIDDTHGNTPGRADGQGGGGKQAYSRVKTIVKKEKRDPAAVYLEGVRWCIEQRCKIFGLEQPHTVNINWRKQAEEAGLDPEGFVNDLEQQFLDMARSRDARSLGSGAEEA